MATIYAKVPGLGAGGNIGQIALRSRLYYGPDHLLIVQSTGYTEEYKRIFFRDIRYVEVRKTEMQAWYGVISAVIFILVALLYFVNLPWGLVIVFCFPFAIWFLANLVAGPACECYIATNVQTLKLPTPRRTKKIATLIEFLRGQTAAFASPGA